MKIVCLSNWILTFYRVFAPKLSSLSAIHHDKKANFHLFTFFSTIFLLILIKSCKIKQVSNFFDTWTPYMNVKQFAIGLNRHIIIMFHKQFSRWTNSQTVYITAFKSEHCDRKILITRNKFSRPCIPKHFNHISNSDCWLNCSIISKRDWAFITGI